MWRLVVVLVLALIIALAASVYTVQPGYRGVAVTLGKASSTAVGEGVHFRYPFVTRIVQTPIRQQTLKSEAPCFSSDLQTVTMQVAILYRIPEKNVVMLYRDYQQNIAVDVVAPRFQEALKEVTALSTAEQIVKNREQVKLAALEGVRRKLDGLVEVDDMVLENIDLTDQLEAAIEAKMVQEQEAAKAKFVQTKTATEAETAIIKAKGEAEAIRVRAEALVKNPLIIDLEIVEKWNGVAPLVVGDVSGANMLLPLRGAAPAAARAN